MSELCDGWGAVGGACRSRRGRPAPSTQAQRHLLSPEPRVERNREDRRTFVREVGVGILGVDRALIVGGAAITAAVGPTMVRISMIPAQA